MKPFKDFIDENTLYYPTINATRGTNIGMTQVDVSKTIPANDKTVVLPFPNSIKNKKRKIKKQKKKD